MLYVKLKKDVPGLLRKGQILEIGPFNSDAKTGEYVIFPMASESERKQEIRVKMSDCEEVVPLCEFSEMQKYDSCDFYQIFEEEGTKMVRLFGYFYTNGEPGVDESGAENAAYSYRRVEYETNYCALSKFMIKPVRKCALDMYKTYIEDITEDMAYEMLCEDGLKELAFSELTMGTPNGLYISREME